ncbi:hypothetical protein LZ32DRAFT_179567 [Colletotrichum eremochloae]|nr:hypothetical protein LZ32DRAFT_179567 [Colletotrichum eremochloae]
MIPHGAASCWSPGWPECWRRCTYEGDTGLGEQKGTGPHSLPSFPVACVWCVGFYKAWFMVGLKRTCAKGIQNALPEAGGMVPWLRVGLACCFFSPVCITMDMNHRILIITGGPF